jgi:1,4-dihydroxy-6-naphthoate synthase
MNKDLHFTLGFSPCPNDTFIFDALVHNKIDMEGLSFRPVIEDVETLNQHALSAQLDISKLSFYAYAFLSDKYQLLDAGAALGSGVGPLLISKKEIREPQKELRSVAIPGELTTANFLFSLFYPQIKNKKVMVFSDIEDAIMSEKVDAGVIIHENRFTYLNKGLFKIADLGSKWEAETGKPIPLGGIAVRRSLAEDVKSKINTLLKKSVEYGFANPSSSEQYIKRHSQDMNDAVIQQHIKLYVNDSSIDLGTEGREAVLALFQKAKYLNIINAITEPVFLTANSMHEQAD